MESPPQANPGRPGPTNHGRGPLVPPPQFERSPTVKSAGLLLPTLLLALLLPSCAVMERASMRHTEPYYLANTPEQFPPKPAAFPMPALSQAPPGSRPIGIFQLKTQKGRAFATQAAIYNARRVGADSLWVKAIHEWSEPYAYDIPEHWEHRYQTVYRHRTFQERGAPGQPDKVRVETVPETVLRQVWVPTQHVSGFNHFTSIDAVMYRYR